ncbi:MAG: hypothetical protein QOK21_373 [Solirubrobacteraceae bacterium]|nr:hypothetical protein [Solirubrobacteraceae bacterium]
MDPVLDVRVYRAAFLPALVALFVAAFSLADRPAPVGSPLSADAFNAQRAFGAVTAPSGSLVELARAFPARTPGSPDDLGLADRVAQALSARDPDTNRPTFQISRLRTPGGGRDPGALETVVGVRPGLSSHRVIVVAHRDAPADGNPADPALAQLSATAALLELARDVRARDLRKTLVLVSTSGASTGYAGARAWAERAAGAGPVDGVLVLGDMAARAVRKPVVVPWAQSGEPAPLRLERTVEAAVRREAGRRPGAAGLIAQWIRRALPATLSEQGPIGGAGLPAVLLSASGERGPDPGEPVSQRTFDRFGRAALRALSAIDRARTNPSGSRLESGPEGIVVLRNVLPDWAVRMLAGALLLPALLTALDAFFRARRRRLAVVSWMLWLCAAAAPLVAAWLWGRVLGLTGALHAPPSPVPLNAVPLDAGDAVALVSVLAVAALAWLGLRPLIGAGRAARGRPAAGGLAATSGLVLAVGALLAWVADPYLAVMVLPAAHAWLFTGSPHGRMPFWAAVAALAVGLVAPLLAVAYYALAFAAGPIGLPWLMLLGVAGGHVSVLTLAVAAALLAALVAQIRILADRRGIEAAAPPEKISTRGPVSYAGPGSLGGTESALRP